MRKLRVSRRMAILAASAAVVALAGAGTVLADPGGWFANNDNPWPYNSQGSAPVLAAVGDISCQPGPKVDNEKLTDTCDQGVMSTVRNTAQASTSQEVENMKPALVAVLGDEQYQNGYYQDFEGSFEKYWGGSKFIQRPAPGNHEFYDNHGQAGVRGLGYFDYYNGIQHSLTNGSEVDQTVTDPLTGHTVTSPVTHQPIMQPTPQQDGQAGDFGTTGNGWYSYNLGAWHLISLNIECADEPGGCTQTGSWFSSETQWLQQDLDQDHAACTLAYWHQPTFSSTADGSVEGPLADTWWKLLYAHHATLVLNGHDHVYTRFKPMDPAGNYDPHGIREFIVGTGGESLDTIDMSTPNMQAWADQYYGVLKLTLHPDSYSYDYESAMVSPTAPPMTPSSFSDKGSGPCMGGGDDDSQ